VSPKICIRKKDRQWGWLTLDFRDDQEIERIVVVPTYGPNHNALHDCWCGPKDVEGVIVHNEVH